MVQLTVFHYIHKNSVLHQMDGRIKLVCLLIISMTVSFASTKADFTLLTMVLLGALFLSQLPILAVVKELKYFAFLILLVFVVNSFSIPGTPIDLIPGITWEGVISGITFGWRLLLVIIICIILTGTTSLSLLRNAVEWFLRPIPFIPESRVATMINLVFVLIPLIFDQAAEMISAQKARYVEGRKNPIKRILFLVYPLLTQTFLRADELVLAMEARCYSEQRTRAIFKATMKDWLVLLFTMLISIKVIL